MEPINKDYDPRPWEEGWHYASFGENGSIFSNFYIGDKKPDFPDQRFNLYYFFEGYWYPEESG